MIKNESLSSLSLHATRNHFPSRLQQRRIFRAILAPNGTDIDESGMLSSVLDSLTCGILSLHLFTPGRGINRGGCGQEEKLLWTDYDEGLNVLIVFSKSEEK